MTTHTPVFKLYSPPGHLRPSPRRILERQILNSLKVLAGKTSEGQTLTEQVTRHQQQLNNKVLFIDRNLH